MHPTKSLLASLSGSPRDPCSLLANIHSHAVSGSSPLCLFHYSICIYFCQLSKKAPDIQVSLPRPLSNPHRGPYARTGFSSPLPLWSLQFYISLWPSGSVRGKASHVFNLLSGGFTFPPSEGSLVLSTFLCPAMSNAGHSPPPLHHWTFMWRILLLFPHNPPSPTFNLESCIIIYSPLSLIHGHMTLQAFPLTFLQFYFYFLPVTSNMLMALANFNMNINHLRKLDPINFQWLLLASYKVLFVSRLCEGYWTRKASVTSTFCSLSSPWPLT